MTQMKKHSPDFLVPDRPMAVQSFDASFKSDLVDRVFEYLVELVPEIRSSQVDLAHAEAQIRREFAGQTAYIPARSANEKVRERHRVLQLWDGNNVKEIARTLGISRATVYRHLRQPG
ncbi:helix-turn-helix domain-containing protein [Delftia tsuruhatensis]|uniref:helix-turn-helix domain-containing protein n=1 Tax=Delftia tsuruhatensis TaxID=180282 RepID=UPI0031D3C8D3